MNELTRSAVVSDKSLTSSRLGRIVSPNSDRNGSLRITDRVQTKPTNDRQTFELSQHENPLSGQVTSHPSLIRLVASLQCGAVRLPSQRLPGRHRPHTQHHRDIWHGACVLHMRIENLNLKDIPKTLLLGTRMMNLSERLQRVLLPSPSQFTFPQLSSHYAAQSRIQVQRVQPTDGK